MYQTINERNEAKNIPKMTTRQVPFAVVSSNLALIAQSNTFNLILY